MYAEVKGKFTTEDGSDLSGSVISGLISINGLAVLAGTGDFNYIGDTDMLLKCMVAFKLTLKINSFAAGPSQFYSMPPTNGYQPWQSPGQPECPPWQKQYQPRYQQPFYATAPFNAKESDKPIKE